MDDSDFIKVYIYSWLKNKLGLVNKYLKAQIFSVLVFFFFTGCAKHNGVEDKSDECNFLKEKPHAFQFEKLEINPLETDPEITLETDQRHLVFIPHHLASLKDELFVFLPGTDATPSSYENIMHAAAFVGYKTIGLCYHNNVTIFSRCSSAPGDPDCSILARQENQEGIDVSDQIEVAPADCINNRLIKLLQWLHASRPNKGWDKYYNGNETVWSKMIFAGHSQGAAQTAYISKIHVIARAIHFSHIGELYGDKRTGDLQITPWSLEPRLTPASRIYLLYHIDEQTALWSLDVCKAIGIVEYGDVQNVDNVAAPYNCSHVLSIGTPAVDQHEAHNMTAYDAAMPMGSDNLPLYTEAIMYMITAGSQ